MGPKGRPGIQYPRVPGHEVHHSIYFKEGLNFCCGSYRDEGDSDSISRRFNSSPIPDICRAQKRTRTVAPVALKPFVIRWGSDLSSDFLRRAGRCTVCGNKGATLR
jgi:hypothetical protein